MGRWRFAVVALSVLASCNDQKSADPAPTPISQQASANPLPIGTGFDFWVLSLSWSPSYCEAEGASANRQQCASGRPYAFVVHGLWPQYERGWPENCGAQKADLSDALVRSLYDIMPSAGLIRYQWQKHGGCSGLSASDYFTVLRAARERIAVPQAYRDLTSHLTVVPDAVERDFLKSNAGLTSGGIAVSCDERYLREVRICFSNDLQFRACPEVDRRACRFPSAVMPPTRGG